MLPKCQPGTLFDSACVALLLVIVVGWCAPVGFGAQPTFRVTGTVRAESGAPLPGVRIDIIREKTVVLSTTTDAKGEFAADVEPGVDRIRATLPGFEVAIVRLQKVDTTSERVTIELEELVQTAPPPPPPVPQPTPPPENYAKIPVFYATDRRGSFSAPAPPNYDGTREPTEMLHFGRLDVSIPNVHVWGKIERPGIWRLLERGSKQAYRYRGRNRAH
jgi:hypothetical protein